MSGFQAGDHEKEYWNCSLSNSRNTGSSRARLLLCIQFLLHQDPSLFTASPVPDSQRKWFLLHPSLQQTQVPRAQPQQQEQLFRCQAPAAPGASSVLPAAALKSQQLPDIPSCFHWGTILPTAFPTPQNSSFPETPKRQKPSTTSYSSTLHQCGTAMRSLPESLKSCHLLLNPRERKQEQDQGGMCS